MPYKLKGNCVVKSDTGATVKCHATHAEAVAHLRALYANVKDAHKEMLTPQQVATKYHFKEKDFAYAQSESWVVDSVVSALSNLLSIARQEMYQNESDDAREMIQLIKQLMSFGNDQVQEMDDALSQPDASTLGLYKEASEGGYLVTDDAGKHLPTRKNGKLDHRLMAAAKAALTSNYRGHAYQGSGKDKAITKLKALYKQEGLQWDEKESTLASQKLFITKDAKTDKYRWTLFTSSSFKDRDKDILSQAALEKDCDEMDLTGEYGILNFWHCDGLLHAGEKEVRPFIPLGSCDMSFMRGKVNIESGLFYDDRVGEKMLAQASQLAASKEFFYLDPTYDKETDANVYSYIRTKGRALLPRGKESNLLTRLFVWRKDKEMADNKERVAKFKEVLADEDLAEDILKQADAIVQKAEQYKLASKETTADMDEAEPDADDAAKKKAAAKKTDAAAKETDELALAVKEAMGDALKPILNALEKSNTATAEANKELVKRVNTLEKQIRTLAGIGTKGHRASEDPDNEVDEQDPLAEKAAEAKKLRDQAVIIEKEIADAREKGQDFTTPEGHLGHFISSYDPAPMARQ